jgi:hypothetical protein
MRSSVMTKEPDMIRAPRPSRRLRRLLLVALMGLALASRLALGAVILPAAAAPASMNALARLQAAMILCHPGEDRTPPVPLPHHRAPAGDLLLAADQADNAHALASDGARPARPASVTAAEPAPPPASAAPPPRWRRAWQARGPPHAV